MHTPKQDFEKLKFSSFDLQNNVLNNNNDRDENFFKANHFIDTNYFTMEENKSNFLTVMISFFQYFIWI